MLITNKTNTVKANDIVIVRIASGEEVIGKLVDQTPTVLALYRPQIVHLQFTQTGGAGAAPIPLMVTAENDDRVEILADKLMTAPMIAKSELADEYRRQTSPIVTPPSSKLIV